MLLRLLDLNKILLALFIVGLFAIGAAATARFGADSVAVPPADQSTYVQLPTGLAEAQDQIEAPQLNDTKALLTIILGGIAATTVVGFGALLAALCWLLDRQVKQSSARS
ncbi:MAG: hypothetical protein ACE5FI_08435 [Anaerolineales bacterium]